MVNIQFSPEIENEMLTKEKSVERFNYGEDIRCEAEKLPLI